VRHAIATRYVKRQVGNSAANLQEEYDLVQDISRKAYPNTLPTFLAVARRN
jgi:hypothetical protein